MDVLFELEKKLRREVNERYLGKTFRILLEENSGADWREGRADNYVAVRILKQPLLQARDFVNVEIKKVEDDHLFGTQAYR